jgi:hypothetical protein
MSVDTGRINRVTDDVQQLTWRDVSARRLARHGLADRRTDTIADIVAAMCGAHAQIASAAELSIGLRGTGITRTDVRNAVAHHHDLIKTFGPRGTVHLLPARELPMWVGALAAVPGQRFSLPETARMSDQQLDETVAAIGDAMLGAELTADELGEAVVSAVGAWAGELVVPAFGGWWPRWRQAVAVAAHRGALVFGTPRARTVTYTNPRTVLAEFEPGSTDTAPHELVRHFLHAYGPATSNDFARWLSAPRAWAAEIFAGVNDDLMRVQIDGGRPAWMLARDSDEPASAPRGLRLLPYFDPYVVGSYPRELLYPGIAYTRALAGGQAGNFPVLLIDGVVMGVWHLRRAGKRLHITVEPLTKLSAKRLRELDEQVQRVAEIAEGTPTLTIDTVTVGAHA